MSVLETKVAGAINTDQPTSKDVARLVRKAFKVEGEKGAIRKAGESLSGDIVAMGIRCKTKGNFQRVIEMAEGLMDSSSFAASLEKEGIQALFKSNKKTLRMPSAWSTPVNTVKRAFELGVPLMQKADPNNAKSPLVQATESTLRKQVANAAETKESNERHADYVARVGEEALPFLQRVQAALSDIGKHLFNYNLETLEAIAVQIGKAQEIANAYAKAEQLESPDDTDEESEEAAETVGEQAEQEVDAEENEIVEQKPTKRARRRA